MRDVTRLLGAPVSTSIALRDLTSGDIGWITRRQGPIYASEHGWDMTYEALVAESLSGFVRNFDATVERAWIADREGKIVGSIFLVRVSADVAKLRLRYVEPSARGLGIGRRLVKTCIAAARECGYQTFTLWTNDVLLAARYRYQAAGFPSGAGRGTAPTLARTSAARSGATRCGRLDLAPGTLAGASSMLANFTGLQLDSMPSLERGEASLHRVRQVRASAQSLRGFGTPVEDFATHAVTIVTWPQGGWRPIVAGTGNEGGVVQDRFVMERQGEIQYATNRAVGRSYLTGWFADPAHASAGREPRDVSRIYTHEANYHPDGGQIFCPRQATPFVALLAPPGDDVQPDDFVAFYCDGTFGIHIDPGVWHQPVFPLQAQASFDDRQGRVHACVAVNFVAEFGCYLDVPLVPQTI